MLFLRSFNPRTRRACDSIDKDGNVVFDVSIHARVERATTHDEFLLFDIVVSIHARVERATLGVYVGFWLTPVSIHARVERATKTMTLLFYRKLCFNPRTRRACDIHSRKHIEAERVSIHARVERATREQTFLEVDLMFQSTHA